MRYRLISGFAAVMLTAFCCGCAEQDPHGSSAATEREAETVEAFVFSQEGTEKTDLHFLPDYSQLALKAPEGAEIRYTLDGSVPDAESDRSGSGIRSIRTGRRKSKISRRSAERTWSAFSQRRFPLPRVDKIRDFWYDNRCRAFCIIQK